MLTVIVVQMPFDMQDNTHSQHKVALYKQKKTRKSRPAGQDRYLHVLQDSL